MNKNKLLIAFVILLAIYTGVSVFSDKKEESFNDKILNVDIENIDLIKIKPKDEVKSEFTLVKTNGNWVIKSKENDYEADSQRIENLLSNFDDLRISSIVTKKPEKWKDYEVTDDDSKQIELYAKENKVLALIIGKFKYNPQARTANSYVRVKGEDRVFSTERFSGLSIADNYTAYRIKTIAQFDKENIKSISYSHFDKKYEINNDGNNWKMGDRNLDSLKMISYISALSNMKGNKFVDYNNGVAASKATDIIKLGFDGDKSIEIKAIPDTLISKGFIINSTANKDAYFESDSTGIYKRIFGKLDEILK